MHVRTEISFHVVQDFWLISKFMMYKVLKIFVALSRIYDFEGFFFLGWTDDSYYVFVVEI